MLSAISVLSVQNEKKKKKKNEKILPYSEPLIRSNVPCARPQEIRLLETWSLGKSPTQKAPKIT